ncbi:MAG: hypothetical protein ACREBW_01840, partial [Candidatus Micrarchaeaceae archaeon]
MSGETGPLYNQMQYHNRTPGQEYAEQFLARNEVALVTAVSTAYPEKAGQAPEAVFPERTEPRNAAPDPEWDAATANTMRRILGEFGVGRGTDENISALGLPHGPVVAVVEAGQAHKIKAELEMIEQDVASPIAQIIFAGSPKREIKSSDERASTVRQLGKMPDTYTEYYVAGQMAMHMKGFTALPQPEILKQSYTVSRESGFTVGTDETGQFVKVGTAYGADVILMRLDREDYTDSEGKPKYRNQPEYGDVMQIVSASVTVADTSVAYLTSNTYK